MFQKTTDIYPVPIHLDVQALKRAVDVEHIREGNRLDDHTPCRTASGTDVAQKLLKEVAYIPCRNVALRTYWTPAVNQIA